MTSSSENGLSLSDEEWSALRARVADAVSRACPRWFAGHEDDIVQNIMTQLARYLERSGGNREFSTIYLAKAAHGAAVDEMRRWFRGSGPRHAGEGMMERLPAQRGDPERESAAGEIGAAIRDCLARLIRSRRLGVVLYLQGCTVPESARLLRWTLSKTEKLVYRGLKDLRRCLVSKGVGP
jgi:RNA polymerase sigma-70 factor (ECF subfamily)